MFGASDHLASLRVPAFLWLPLRGKPSRPPLSPHFMTDCLSPGSKSVGYELGGPNLVGSAEW